MHFKSTRALQRMVLMLDVPVGAVGGMIVDMGSMSVSFSVFRALLTLREVWGCNPWMCFNHCNTQLEARGPQACISANTLMGPRAGSERVFCLRVPPAPAYFVSASSACMYMCVLCRASSVCMYMCVLCRGAFKFTPFVVILGCATHTIIATTTTSLHITGVPTPLCCRGSSSCVSGRGRGWA
jgi:hypothetical protein